MLPDDPLKNLEALGTPIREIRESTAVLVWQSAVVILRCEERVKSSMNRLLTAELKHGITHGSALYESRIGARTLPGNRPPVQT